MRLNIPLLISGLSESLTPLPILSVSDFIVEGEIITRRHLKDRTSDLCLTIPFAFYDSVDIFNLHKLVELKF